MSKVCPKCKAENRDQAKFCQSCNFALSVGDTPIRYCESGRHPMDPGWETCPYCNAGGTTQKEEETGRRATVAETPNPLRPPSPPPVPPPPSPRGRRKTVFQAPQSDGGVPASPAGTRKTVALLVTYTWNPGGDVFPVREGRNYLGRDPECEICIADDPQLSGRNTVILVRGQNFWIDDEKSMNGTFVEEVSIEEKLKLKNYSKIRTGATVWRFLMVEPSSEE